jgi:DNA-binding LytR/AlgR family response regulator
MKKKTKISRRIVLPGWEKDNVIEDQYKITHIEVNNKNCIIYIDKVQDALFPLISMKKLEAMLDPEVFLRCHRSHIINMKFGKWYRFEGRGAMVTLADEKTEIPVAVLLVKAFMKILRNFPHIKPEKNQK